MKEAVIKVKNLAKKFSKSSRKNLEYGMTDMFRGVVGLPGKSHILRAQEFWALKDISFTVRRGESVGVIGANGSGKSTLFKLLNGIFMPDRGKIIIKGKVGALIGVGAGFHPVLTGRENIYINGVILGMKKKEIDKKFSEIVDFAGVADFLDTPVKNYSSGMLVRLGFSVAIFCEPDILLIDEVLAVGDQDFQEKSLRKLKEMAQGKTTILFVSHDIQAIRQLCTRTLILSKGKMRGMLPTEKAVSRYLQYIPEKKA